MKHDLQSVARALGGVVSGGQILAPGPGHSKHDRSLSVKLDSSSPDGFIVHSFSGDDMRACRDHVRRCLGLAPFDAAPKVSDFDIFDGRKRTHEQQDTRAGAEAAGEPPASHPTHGLPFVRWTYRDASGGVLGYICRFDKPGGKLILPLTPKPASDGTGWQWKGFAAPRPLYGLDRLAARPEAPVLVVEGEKAADAAEALCPGHVAVTSPGGSESAHKAVWSPVAGRDVTVWPDADIPGRKYAKAVIGLLRSVGARSIRLVNVAGLPDKWDLADPMPDGVDIAALLAQAADLTRVPGLVSARDLEHKEFPELQWVVPGFLPEGLTMLAGRPKIGKSWLTLDLCVAVARGGYTLGNSNACREGDVLYCALEDNERRLQRRMRKAVASGWPARLMFRTELPRLEDGGLAELQRWCESVPAPRLIAIDTLAKIRKSKSGKETDYEADYRAMDGLTRLAALHSMSVVVVHHVRKADAMTDPFDAISGTTGLTGSVDAAIVLNRGANGVTLYTRGRDIEELEKAVEFRASDCRWHVLGDASEIHQSDERRQILDALRQAKGEIGPAAIARETGMKATNVRFLLGQMLGAGEVEKTSIGKYRPRLKDAA